MLKLIGNVQIVDRGPRGEQGPPGSPAPLFIGRITTGDYPNVTIRKETINEVDSYFLDFTLPSSMNTIQGKSAYELARENGFAGTQDEWLDSLHGDQGIQGEKGDKGDKGDQGESVLDLARSLGFTGTPQQYLESLKPLFILNPADVTEGSTPRFSLTRIPGGENGPDTYQMRVTIPRGEKGDKGDRGEKGETGVSPSVTINSVHREGELVLNDSGNPTYDSSGKVITYQPGVTNSGNETQVKLDFVLPSLVGNRIEFSNGSYLYIE